MTLPLLHIAAHMRTAAANWHATKEPETHTEDFYDAAFYDGWQTAAKWIEELAAWTPAPAFCGPCHTHIHAEPAWSYENGWLCPSHEDPASWPVLRGNHRQLPTETGWETTENVA